MQYNIGDNKIGRSQHQTTTLLDGSTVIYIYIYIKAREFLAKKTVSGTKEIFKFPSPLNQYYNFHEYIFNILMMS